MFSLQVTKVVTVDSTAGFTLDLSGHTFGNGAHTIEVKSGGASFTGNGST